MPSPYASITLPYVVLQAPFLVIFCLLQVHDGGEKQVSGKLTKFTNFQGLIFTEPPFVVSLG